MLEVNVGPSLSSSSLFDKKLKTRLICDTLTLSGVRPYDKYSSKPKGPNIFEKHLKMTGKSESEKTCLTGGKLIVKSPKKMSKISFDSEFFTGLEPLENDDFEVLSEFIEQEQR